MKLFSSFASAKQWGSFPHQNLGEVVEGYYTPLSSINKNFQKMKNKISKKIFKK
jgi:hypothetical protein